MRATAPAIFRNLWKPLRTLTEQQVNADVARRIDNILAHWAETFDDVLEREDIPYLAPMSGASVSLQGEDDSAVRELDHEPNKFAADSSLNKQEVRENRGEVTIDCPRPSRYVHHPRW